MENSTKAEICIYSLESIVLEMVVLLVLVWEVWYVVFWEIIIIVTFEHMSAKKLKFGAYLVSGSYALRGS